MEKKKKKKKVVVGEGNAQDLKEKQDSAITEARDTKPNRCQVHDRKTIHLTDRYTGASLYSRGCFQQIIMKIKKYR